MRTRKKYTVDGMASPGDSHGATQASSSRDITMSCKLQNATSLTMRDLYEITDGFSKERAVGEGSYGRVYRGSLENGEEIAVKLLYNRLETDDTQFQREFENLMRLQHRNIVRLVGFCYETQHKPMIYTGQTIFAEEISKALCFEYMPNGSLEKHLSEEYDGLDWHTRYKIIKGTCEGLQYLHEGYTEPMYHLDLKPDNILLDENMVPKLADFGLSRLFDGQQTMTMKSTVGTIGYMPQEYIFGNIISNKFDVFSLGVVMTRIIAGPRGHTRKAEMSQQEFLDQVEENWRNRLKATLTSREPLEAHCEQVNICTRISLSCMEMDRHKRPNIADIIYQLNDTEATIDKALSWSANARSWMKGGLVKLKALARSEAIPSAETCKEFPVLVQVTSPRWHQAEEMPHTALDVVIVLDGSWWLPTLKQAMRMVINKLGPNDRLSLVAFEANIMKLTYMSDKGRDVAKCMLKELKSDHRSNMSVGLQEGIEILRGREVKEGDNRVGCIMLLSNSEDEAILTQKISSEFPVHTLCYGSEHDPQVMKYIADMTSGTYSCFEHMHNNDLLDACKLLIDGITKVIATSIKITFRTHEGITISSIVSGGYNNRVSSDTQSGEIDIGNIYAGERKNFIIYLKVAENNKKILTISGCYQSYFNASKQLADIEVFVLRPRSTCPPRKLAIHHEVAAELVRIRLVKGLSILIEPGQRLTKYSLEELWDTVRLSEEGLSSLEETMSELGKEVAEITKFSSYKYRNPKKVPYIMSWLSCHKWQRATTKGSCYDSSAFTLSHPDVSKDDED